MFLWPTVIVADLQKSLKIITKGHITLSTYISGRTVCLSCIVSDIFNVE